MKKCLYGLGIAAGSIIVYEYLRQKGVIDRLTQVVEKSVDDLTENHKLKVKGLYQRGRCKPKCRMKDTVDDTVEDIKETVEDIGEALA